MEDIKFEHELRHCDVIEENLHKTMEKLKSTASDVMILNTQWSDLEDHLKSSRETLEKRYREVVSKEVELRKLSFALEERVKVVEAAEAEMLDLEMKSNVFRSEAEERGEDLKQKRKDLTFIVDKITESEKLLETRSSELLKIQAEVEFKGKQLEQMDFVIERQRRENSTQLKHLYRSQTRTRELNEEIERKREDFTSRIAEFEKELKSVEEQLASKKELLEKQSLELVSIKKETGQHFQPKNKELEEIERLIQERTGCNESIELLRKEHSEELASKEKRQNEIAEAIHKLSVEIVSKEQTIQQLSEKQHSKQKQLEILSLELVSKKKEFDGLNLDLDLANSLNDELKETSQQIKSKEKELEDIERLIQERTGQNESIKLLLEEHSEKLASKEKRQDEITDAIHKLSLEIVSKEKTIQQLSEKQHSKQKKLDLIDAEFVLKEKKLCSVKDAYRECLQNWEIKKEELKSLEEDVKKIKESLRKCQAREVEQVKLKASLMQREKELGQKEKQFRARSENIELKEKKLDAWEERLDKKDEILKSEEQKVAKCVKDYENKTKKLDGFFQQNKPDKQVDLVRDASVRDEKTLQLLLHECKQIFFGLQGMNDPAGYVLNLVKNELMSAQRRGELSLTEPIVKHLVSLLEELLHVVRSSTHLLSDALQVADLWSRMLDNSSHMSPLEVWGFLQLILAYELVYKTNRDTTLRFALKVAHFKQAPKLFESLGLGYAILELVKQLLDKRHYLLAVRFILYFNLNYNFNSLKFLKDEIVTLRLSAKDNRRFNSQAEAAKLKDIIELIEDFKLEIDLPVELIVKFMVPREIENQNPYVVSSIVPVQPTFPTILGGSPTQQVLQLETYQAGGSTVVHGQSSHQAGHKRPRVDPSVSGHVIRPCFNQSRYDRF